MFLTQDKNIISSVNLNKNPAGPQIKTQVNLQILFYKNFIHFNFNFSKAFDNINKKTNIQSKATSVPTLEKLQFSFG